MHFSLRSRHLRPSLLASSLLLAVSAQGQEKLDVDLPAAPLGQAINALAQQSSVQILFAGDLGAGRQAPALKGRFTPEEALRQLLRDSGLKAQARDEHTFIVVPASEAAVPATQARSEPLDMEQMEITASRTSSDLVSATRQSTVIEHAQLEELRQGSDSLATVLAKAVPGMSDSSRTITEYGQTLRGRSMLVMVDGVPLNTNRDSSRNLANIDPALIERIEVIRGSSAIYGSGATGGIISITTRPAGGENRAETRLSATSPLTRLGSDGLGGQFQQYFAGSLGALDYSFDFGTRHVGASYDAHGDRIAPEPSQGDLFDSNVYNIGGKLGLRIDENQRVQLALSHYDARQDTDYATDPRVARLPPGSVPANAIKGLELDEQNRIRNTLANLEYENLDILGSRLSAQLYYRDYFTRFTPFDARAVSTRGGNVDQIMQNSEVFGSRLTLRTPLGESGNTELVWGGDYNQERSDMPLDVFDPAAYDASGGLVFDKIGKLTYMPPLRTRSAGAFAQLQHRFDEHWSIDGGLRYEYSTAEFDDFIPLSESKAASPVTVKGGDLDYDAVLSNLGIVYSPVAGQEIYASFSQGFQLPDVGIQLRNARRGFDIGSSNLEPRTGEDQQLRTRLAWRHRRQHPGQPGAVLHHLQAGRRAELQQRPDPHPHQGAHPRRRGQRRLAQRRRSLGRGRQRHLDARTREAGRQGLAGHDRLPRAAAEADRLPAIQAGCRLEQPPAGHLLRLQGLPSRRRGKLRPAPGQHLHHGRPGQPVPHHPRRPVEPGHPEPVQPRLLPALQPVAAQQQQHQPPAGAGHGADGELYTQLVRGGRSHRTWAGPVGREGASRGKAAPLSWAGISVQCRTPIQVGQVMGKDRVRRPAQNTTCPDMPGCTSPPIQISPPICSTLIRPRRPKAVPWLAV